MFVPQQQTSRCGGNEVKRGGKRTHTLPFVCGQTRFDDTRHHYVRSAAACEDTDRLVNMVEPPLIPALSPGLTPLTSPWTTYFIFTGTVSSPPVQ